MLKFERNAHCRTLMLNELIVNVQSEINGDSLAFIFIKPELHPFQKNAIIGKFLEIKTANTEKFVQKIIRTKCSNHRFRISFQEQS